MFMGPYEGNVQWSTRTIQGVRRFVSKYYVFLNRAYENRVEESNKSVKVAIDRLVDKIENDILDFKFNTAVAALMEFYNSYSKEKFDNKDLEKLVIVSAPILPHISEEIWCNTMGKKYSVHTQKWPEIDKELLEDEKIEIPVQINGKVRGKILISKESTQDQIQQIVLSSNTLGPLLSEKQIKKFVYVPQRIVSIVL